MLLSVNEVVVGCRVGVVYLVGNNCIYVDVVYVEVYVIILVCWFECCG